MMNDSPRPDGLLALLGMVRTSIACFKPIPSPKHFAALVDTVKVSEHGEGTPKVHACDLLNAYSLNTIYQTRYSHAVKNYAGMRHSIEAMKAAQETLSIPTPFNDQVATWVVKYEAACNTLMTAQGILYLGTTGPFELALIQKLENACNALDKVAGPTVHATWDC